MIIIFYSPSGRTEHLTEHVLFWNQKKIISLPKYLSLRYVKVSYSSSIILITQYLDEIEICI